MTSKTLDDIYRALLAAYGPQHWWPGETPTEIAIGAILTQNTNWRNVEKAIDQLRRADMLSWPAIHAGAFDHVAELIRPAGYFRVKTKRLKNFAAWLTENHDGRIETLEQLPLYEAREQLIGINGIGPETADSILLYALNMPTFVVDAYTARLAIRHGLIDESADYADLKSLFEDNLPEDVQLFNEYHALIVNVGKHHCRPRPRCEGCPLECFEHQIEGF